MKKKLKTLYIITVALTIGTILLAINPINRRSTNLLFIGAILALYTCFIVLSWKNKILRLILFILPVILLSLLTINGPEIDKEVIRSEYVKALIKYEGTKYVWGGETSLGIDCSGLVRRGLIDTYIRLGFLNISPQYIRKGIYLWYNDLSAEAIGNEYANRTVKVFSNQVLNDLDYEKIKEGDIMVTENGVHAMAYIGNREWIQADPSEQKVIIEKAPDDNNTWYKVPSKILRWKDLY
ncbi:MAG: outer membrane lipoprotein [Firmicutes bacterium ADurb.Bin419]|nr:MAG: outer membrane lipoprotein [Firmicutes bacterium ADurb.Bin419]